jgi:hypothetical protein
MTLHRAPCGHWWFWDWDHVAGWPYLTWRPVRWYHWRLHRQIAAHWNATGP